MNRVTTEQYAQIKRAKEELRREAEGCMHLLGNFRLHSRDGLRSGLPYYHARCTRPGCKATAHVWVNSAGHISSHRTTYRLCYAVQKERQP